MVMVQERVVIAFRSSSYCIKLSCLRGEIEGRVVSMYTYVPNTRGLAASQDCSRLRL